MKMGRDTITADLFAWEPPTVAVGYAGDVAGKGPLDSKIARLLARALRDAKDENGLSRAEIVIRLSSELGRSISGDMLDKWTSEAAGQHRIPLDAFVSLIKVTGAKNLLGFIPEMFGFAVVPIKYAGLIELQLLEDHEKDVAVRKAALQAQLRARR